MSSTSPERSTSTIEHVQGVPVVAIIGRLDTQNASAFDAQTAMLLAQPCPRILLDMQSMTYISSMGLRSILRLIKHAAVNGGRAGAFSVPPMVLEVLEISGFPTLMDIFSDRESALNGVRA